MIGIFYNTNLLWALMFVATDRPHGGEFQRNHERDNLLLGPVQCGNGLQNIFAEMLVL